MNEAALLSPPLTESELFLGGHAVEFLKVSDIDQMLEKQGFMDGIMNGKIF